MTRWIALLAFLIPLAACATGDRRSASVTGELTYLERIALPPGAQAQVMLHTAPQFPIANDPGAKSTLANPGMSVAQRTIDITQSVPIPFRLDYRLDGLDPARPLILDAWIFSDDQVLFATAEARQIQMGSSTPPLRLTLRRPRHVAYTCADGSRPAIAFPQMGDLAFVEAQDTAPVALRAEPVGSGFYYTGQGYGLRGKGREALLRRPSGIETRCEAVIPN